MHNNLLSELPASLQDKTGWPWTEDSSSFLCKENSSNWPKISIITPSFNQGAFLEETIRSVLLQNYPNLEYIILDGGSTDNSVEIIKKYDEFIDFWVSEPDNGQADAIYRGIEMATGDIIAYLNSDDIYYPDAFFKVAKEFIKNPDSGWLTGRTVFVDEYSNPKSDQPRYLPINMFNMVYLGNFVMQPSTFWKKKLFLSVGGFDKNLRFSFDYELFLKFLKLEKPLWINQNLAGFRYHSMSKTTNIMDVCEEESYKIRERYISDNTIITNIVGRILGKIYSFFYAFRHR